MRGTSTIVAFYQSAYGPAIRIDVQDIEWLVMFKKALALLTSKAISELDVLSLRNIKKGNIAGFRIVFGIYADVSSVSNDSDPSFVWTVNKEQMEYMIGAIDCYLEYNEPGHHYLYEDVVNIELAYKE